jgi:hypothetical protein
VLGEKGSAERETFVIDIAEADCLEWSNSHKKNVLELKVTMGVIQLIVRMFG